MVFAGDTCGMSAPLDQDKAEFDLAAMKKMGYDAVALGELDFIHGLDFLEGQLKLYPFFVCCNLVWAGTGKPLAHPVLYRTYRLQAAPGRPARLVRVAVFGVLGKSVSPTMQLYISQGPKRVSVLDPVAEAGKIVAIARKKAQLVVALAHMSDDEAKELARQVPGIDVIVMGHGSVRKMATPLKVTSTLLVAESNEGKYVGQLVLSLNSAGQVEASAGRSVTMDEKITDDPAMAEMLKEAKEKWAKTPPQFHPRRPGK